jgi:hypothetical protein
MQQIADWLEKLGMSEYAQRFAENGINVAALRHLTDQDLKDIGVLLGHRRVMLAAIGEIGGPAAAPPAREATVEPKHQERETRCDGLVEAQHCARPCHSGLRWRIARRRPRYGTRSCSHRRCA